MSGIKKLSSAALAAAVAAPAWAQAGNGYYGPGMMWNGGWSGMLLGPLMILVFFGIVIVLVVFSVRSLVGTGGHHSHSDTGTKTDKALEILRERYARGEIDHEEFQEKKKHLSD